jgi:hypothetical protein
VPRHLPTIQALTGRPAPPQEPLRVRTVTDGKLHHVSASQVQTFELCHRKWWFQKVQQLLDLSDTSSRDFGTDGHTLNETYLKGGPAPVASIKPWEAQSHWERVATVASAGIMYLPAPGPNLLVEQILDPPLLFGNGELVPWEGRIDWLTQPVEYRDPATGLHWHQFQVGDHKFTKNFRYAKSSAELRTLTQFVSYAYWRALQAWGPGCLTQGGYRIMGTHVYYHTQPYNLGRKAAKAKRVDCWLETKDIPALISSLNRTVEAMVATAKLSNQDDVPGERSACGAFGGCPFRAQCTIGKRPNPMDDDKSIPATMASLLRRPDGAGPAPAAPPPADPLAPPPVRRPDVGPALPVPGDTWAPKAPDLGGEGERPLLVLYIGCVPIVGPHVGRAEPLEVVVEAHSQPIRERMNVCDLRMLAFAEGKGMLAGSLRANPPVGVYFSIKGDELVGVAIEALMPFADVVVRGMA